MFSRLIAYVSVLMMLVAGVQPLHAAADARTQRQIRQAVRDIEPLSEFSTLYSNGFYFLKKEKGRYVVEVRTLLLPCYEIIMRIPIEKPSAGDRVIQNGTAEVELWELQKIYRDEGGNLVVDRGFPQTLINQRNWIKLYNAKGNYSSIGITLKPGLQLKGMDDYRDQLRKVADVGW